MTNPDASFREFALEVYDGDGVAPAALLLQDRSGVDVDVLLLAAFVGAVRGLTLSLRDVQEIQHLVAPWQAEIVLPLRVLRKRLRNGPSPAPTSATTTLRDRIKDLELDAETIELDALAAFVEGFDGPTASGTAAQRAAMAMTVVVHSSTGRTPVAAEHDAIAVIARAAEAAGSTG